MSVEHLHIDVNKHKALGETLLGMLYVNQRLPSLLDTRATAMGAYPIVDLPTQELRALYQAAYSACNGFITQFGFLFGMFPVDFQIHSERGNDNSLSLVLGFGEVNPHMPVYVTFEAEWCDKADFRLRDVSNRRTPWNIRVKWSDEWNAQFKAGKYLSPDLVHLMLAGLQVQLDAYNGYHNAGITDDCGKLAHWFHCEHYSETGLMPEGTGGYRLTTTVELREGAYDFSYFGRHHETVETGEEWGVVKAD